MGRTRFDFFKLTISVVILVFVVALFPSISIFPSVNAQSECRGDFVWREKESASFVIVYTASNVSMAEEIHQNYIQVIEQELPLYEEAFGSILMKPVTIRLYPTQQEYFCLNALAPLITGEDSHSHIGSREIALIANVINRSPMTWEEQAVNALRHELAILFGEKISGGNAPPGLLLGLGGYFENPEEVFPERYRAAGNPTQPDRGLQRLWEEDTSAANPLTMVQQTSTTAYLIEVFGWEKWVEFLNVIGELQGYRQALVEVFGVNIQDLQTFWVQFFPTYVESSWQYNVVHTYDLGQVEQLIAGGAYADAEQILEKLIPPFALFSNQEQLEKARVMQARASAGVHAGNRTIEARQAILSGEFSQGYSAALEAKDIYQQLEDSRRIAELDVYLEITGEILALREELQSLRGTGTPLDPTRSQRIVEIGRRLSALGDEEGTQQAQLALLLLGTGQRVFVGWVTVVGLIVCVFLIWRQLKAVRSRAGVQVRLL